MKHPGWVAPVALQGDGTMKLLATAAVLALVLPQAARAAEPIRIGLVMPYSAGPYVPLANHP